MVIRRVRVLRAAAMPLWLHLVRWGTATAFSQSAGRLAIPGEYQCDTTAAERAELLLRWREAVSEDFDVVEGVFDFVQNWTQPVGRYAMPDFPSQEAPRVLCAETQVVPSPYLSSLCNRTYVMGPRDALVLLLCTPPPVRYLGLRSYTVFRFQPSPWLPSAELADPIDQLSINTTAAEGQDVFRKTAAVISTGDGITASKMRAALERSGLPSSAINLDVVSSDRAYFRDSSKVWVRDRSDAFTLVFRVSSFVDYAEVEPYLQTRWPVFLLRAKPSSLRPTPAQPLNTPPLKPRGTGETQESLVPQVSRLVASIVRDMSDGFNASLHNTFTTEHVLPDIDRCLTDPTYVPISFAIPEWGLPAIPTCGFFTRDALYSWISRDGTNFTDLTFPRHRVYFLVGVNQPLLGKAEYINIFLTTVTTAEQVGHTFNYSQAELQGSALRYVNGGGMPDADKLFAVKLARSCAAEDDDAGALCSEVPVSAINLTEYVYVVQRLYLEPSTTIGPSPDEVLRPLVLSFDLPQHLPPRSPSEDERLATATERA